MVVAEGDQSGNGSRRGRRDVVAAATAGFVDELLAAQFAQVVRGLSRGVGGVPGHGVDLAGEVDDGEPAGRGGQREHADLVYGRMRAPGQIFLYEQPAGERLRDFMRFGVLLQEIGHHLLQHGVRKVGGVRRQSDHEQFAELFVARWRPVVRAALDQAG